MDYYEIVDTLLGKIKDKKVKKLIAENYETFIDNAIKTSNIYSKITKLLKKENINHLVRKIHETPIGTHKGHNIYFDNNQSFVLSRILQLKPINISNLQLSKTEKDIIKKYNVIIKDLHYQLRELNSEYNQKGGQNSEENISWTETIVSLPKYTLLKTAGFLEQLAKIGDTDFSKLYDFKEPLSFIYLVLFLMAQIPFVGGFADFTIIVKALLDQRIFLAIITSITFLLSMIVFHIVDFGMLFKLFYTMDVFSHTRYSDGKKFEREEDTDSKLTENSWFKMFQKKIIEPSDEEPEIEEKVSEGESEITEPTSEELKVVEETKDQSIEEVTPESSTEPKEQTKEETKEEPKEEPKEQTKEETKEEPKEEPKEETKEEPKEEPKEETKEEPKEESKDEPKEETKEGTKEETKEEIKEGTKEETKEELKIELKEEAKEEPKVELKEEIKGESKEEPKEEIQLEIKSVSSENEPKKETAISKIAEKPTVQTGGNIDPLVGSQGAGNVGERILVQKIDNRKKLGGKSNFKIVREENRIRIIKMDKFDNEKSDDISTFSH